MTTEPLQADKARTRRALAALLLLSAFMYLSIMYKIINYGP